MRATSFFYPAVIFFCLCTACKTEFAQPPTQKPLSQKTPAQIQAEALVREMCDAAAKGDVQRVRSFINEGVSVGVRDDGWQRTPLHFAAEAGRVEIARVLIASGATVDARDSLNMTPLHLAASSGRKEMVELLLACGARINVRGGELRDMPLHGAVMAWDYSDAAEELVRVRRPDVNEEDDLYLDLQKEYSEQLIVEITQLLLAHGADARAEDRIGATVLDCAIVMDAPVQAIDMLLAHGADPIAKSEEGLSSLHVAVSCRREDAIPVLLKWGANINVRDRDKQTPLHEAVWQDDAAMVELLIDHGAALDARDRNGDTPAHIAALIGDTALYDLLVAKGASVAVKNKRGLTPPDCIHLAPPKEMIRLSEDDVRPYSVIVTNLRAVRSLLRSWRAEMIGISFDHVWIPSVEDIGQAETIMRLAGENDKPPKKGSLFGRRRLSSDLNQYNREYCGYTKGKARYIVCHMYAGIAENPPDNDFTGVMDGGCSVMLAVIALDRQRVLGAVCNGM